MKPLPKVVGYIAFAGSVATGVLAFIADPTVSPLLASLIAAPLLAKVAAFCGLVAAMSHSLTGSGGAK